MNFHNTIPTKNNSFLERIQSESGLKDLEEAKDSAQVVFRVMRDSMPKEISDRVISELSQKTHSTNQIASLWREANPLLFLLNFRLINSHLPIVTPFSTNDNLFVARVEQESSLVEGDGETVIQAVFSAIKDKLSQERILEIAEFLPGQIREFWLNSR
jgi:uncharacterized protein (DUF2267 family)